MFDIHQWILRRRLGIVWSLSRNLMLTIGVERRRFIVYPIEPEHV